MFQRILVAVDQSEIGELAFTTGAFLAKTLNARLMLVHVISPAALSGLTPVYPIPDAVYAGGYDRAMTEYQQAWNAVEQSASHLLQDLKERAIADNITVDVSSPIGEPAHAVCQIANHWQADLIVIGRHHHSQVGELFWGSVSNFVMHHANCHVLLAQKSSEQSTP
ncbi:MAG TPA: universal stress protein [Microcoleaceae cyanobacterium]|jgi:nucleotide-binding universal stress UspA family protein